MQKLTMKYTPLNSLYQQHILTDAYWLQSSATYHADSTTLATIFLQSQHSHEIHSIFLDIAKCNLHQKFTLYCTPKQL